MIEFVKVPMALWARLLECAEVTDKAADAQSEYVFGPWVAVKHGDSLRFGDYQWRGDGDNEYIHRGSWRPFDERVREYRRAYRIGEWQTHDGGPCPVPPETLIEIGDRWAHGMVARASSFMWSQAPACKITRWRPLAKSQRALERDYFHLGAEA